MRRIPFCLPCECVFFLTLHFPPLPPLIYQCFRCCETFVLFIYKFTFLLCSAYNTTSSIINAEKKVNKKKLLPCSFPLSLRTHSCRTTVSHNLATNDDDERLVISRCEKVYGRLIVLHKLWSSVYIIGNILHFVCFSLLGLSLSLCARVYMRARARFYLYIFLCRRISTGWFKWSLHKKTQH